MIKSRFPIFTHQPKLVYLDSAATAQRLDIVLEAMQRYHETFNANVHRGLYPLAEEATAAYEAVRDQIAVTMKTRSREEVVFTHGTTEGLNLVAQGFAPQFLKPGDEIVLTILEHHSNLVPWQMTAQKIGAVLKFCPLTKRGILDENALEKLITRRTKIVSVTGLSNTLGFVVDLPRVIARAHAVGAKVCVDAAQYAAHFSIDFKGLDADFLVFSGHKIYGPTGVGVLLAKRDLLEKLEPWMVGGDMIREVRLDHTTWNDLPWKFEAGTPPIAEVMGLGAAISFFHEIGWDGIQKHDRELYDYAKEKLSAFSFVKLLGQGNVGRNCGSLSFVVKDVHPHDVAALLGEKNICVRAGHHCTMPLIKALGVPSTTRMSFGIYNTKEDIDRAVSAIRGAVKLLRR